MLDLSSKEFSLTVYDSLSGLEHTLLYRQPTTAEYIETCNQISREENKEESANILIEAADKLITGFEKGSISVDGIEISSNPDDDNYYETWKKLIKENAERLLIELGTHVFIRTRSYVKKKNTTK